ncbi:hypothetical protein CVT24_010819 [Panaeolus cyanescens]|uniref:MIOS-like alpha-solenoid domain-containing protein n=1 Tax=Panaeolus cyanescens TaxID=181874 RepID=A0A409VH44_9AGAR|nr:hypothetical protein CVT24_010819 [Panaeolus cyanescens]
MIPPTEKRLLWHPRRENKFVVGGNTQITLYEWAPEYPEIRHVTSRHDLQFMKCFAWSPDPAFDDLFAVGASTGKVDLIRLEAGKHAQKNSILSNGPSASLPVRNSRPCNALSFNMVDPNFLAVGLDKVRGDSSLVIWDINAFLPSLSIPVVSPSEAPLLVNLPPRPQPTIPRIEAPNRIDSRIYQQHAPAEIVTSLAFLPTSTYLLLAGISHRWFRLFDLRSQSAPQVNVASKINGITTDPFDPHRIACYGDSLVTVWDARKLATPLLMFSERDASADGASIRPGSTYSQIEFSSTKRNCLATMEKDSNYVRYWDLTETKVYAMDGSFVAGGGSSDGETRASRDSARAQRRSWAANLPWPGGTPAQNSPRERDPSLGDAISQVSFVLADTRRTKSFPRQLSSFALVPNAKSGPTLTSNVMVVNKEGDLEVYAIHDNPKQLAWSPRGDLAFGSAGGVKVVDGFKDEQRDQTEAGSEPKRRAGSGYRYDSVSRERRFMEDRLSRSRSRRRDDSRSRGRSGKFDNAKGHLIQPLPVLPTAPPPALFGRGDEDGFPSLQSVNTPTGLSATRPVKPRTYSPAAVRKYHTTTDDVDRSVSRRRSPSRTDTLPADDAWDTGARASPMLNEKRRGREKSRKIRSGAYDVEHLIKDDVSVSMMKRTLAGYGLSKPQHNVSVTRIGAEDGMQALSDLWAWIYHSQEVLSVPTPRLHGYDFSFQGLAGLWEGFPPIALPGQTMPDETPTAGPRTLLDVPNAPQMHHSLSGSTTSSGEDRHSSRRSHSPADDFHGNWTAALRSLASRRGADRSTWKPPVSTSKLVQRQLALQVCGWSLREDELTAAIDRWEKEGMLSRAACWLVFTKQYAKAVEVLLRSEDETYQMMSGTIAALALQSSHLSAAMREYYERLINRLSDPYFRAMLTHLAVGDWGSVLEEDLIPFRERLAIAFQFLDDRSLSAHLRRAADEAARKGNIEAIIVTGLTPKGMDIMQAYLDHTGDVQTVAILSCYVCPLKFRDRRAERWLETYRDLLDSFKLHRHRVGFDIERGQILHEAIQMGDVPPHEWVPRQLVIRCHYCGKPANNSGPLLVNQPVRAKVRLFVFGLGSDTFLTIFYSPRLVAIVAGSSPDALFAS